MKKIRKHLADYWPLISLIAVAALGAAAICVGIEAQMVDWMHYFMGFLFSQFALLKLFDIQGFADGFQMYDLIAKKTRHYALCYPFIELALGIAYFSMVAPVLVYSVTLILMAIGTVGVIIALREGLDIYCPCMGSVLKVPLSTVTLSEDLGMGLMAFFLLVLHA